MAGDVSPVAMFFVLVLTDWIGKQKYLKTPQPDKLFNLFLIILELEV